MVNIQTTFFLFDQLLTITSKSKQSLFFRRFPLSKSKEWMKASPMQTHFPTSFLFCFFFFFSIFRGVFPRTAGPFLSPTDINRHLWELSHRDSSSVGGSQIIITAALPAAAAWRGNQRGFLSFKERVTQHYVDTSKRFSSLPSGEPGMNCPGPHNQAPTPTPTQTSERSVMSGYNVQLDSSYHGTLFFLCWIFSSIIFHDWSAAPSPGGWDLPGVWKIDMRGHQMIKGIKEKPEPIMLFHFEWYIGCCACGPSQSRHQQKLLSPTENTAPEMPRLWSRL